MVNSLRLFKSMLSPVIIDLRRSILFSVAWEKLTPVKSQPINETFFNFVPLKSDSTRSQLLKSTFSSSANLKCAKFIFELQNFTTSEIATLIDHELQHLISYIYKGNKRCTSNKGRALFDWQKNIK